MDINDYFTFAGVDCRRFGVYAFEKDTYSASSMDYQAQAIPGCDGDLLVPQNRYPNQNMTFSCLIYEDGYTNYKRFRAWLLSQVGYKRLESSEHPDEFYMACFKDTIKPKKAEDASMLKFDLVFSRNSRRFLKGGQRVVTITAMSNIQNPTPYEAAPLLRVYGAGTLSIRRESITITAADVYTDIDCEIMESYKGTTSKNDKVVFSNNDYPKLKPGANVISLGTGITQVDITPRWFVR